MTDPAAQPSQAIKPWRQGDAISAARLNEMQDPALRAKGVAPPHQTTQQRSPAGASSVQMKYVSMGDDYVNCHTYSEGVEGAQIVRVAKPYLLRRSPFDGLTRNGVSYAYTADDARTATKGSDSEDQTIVPSYFAGDILYAARSVVGGTDVDGVDYLDDNRDGRAWAATS